MYLVLREYGNSSGWGNQLRVERTYDDLDKAKEFVENVQGFGKCFIVKAEPV